MNDSGLAKFFLSAAAGLAVYIGSTMLMVYRSVAPVPTSMANAMERFGSELITALWWVGGTAVPVFLFVLVPSLIFAHWFGSPRRIVALYVAGFLLGFCLLALRAAALAPTGELLTVLASLLGASPSQFIVSASPFAGLLVAIFLAARVRVARPRSVA